MPDRVGLPGHLELVCRGERRGVRARVAPRGEHRVPPAERGRERVELAALQRVVRLAQQFRLWPRPLRAVDARGRHERDAHHAREERRRHLERPRPAVALALDRDLGFLRLAELVHVHRTVLHLRPPVRRWDLALHGHVADRHLNLGLLPSKPPSLSKRTF